MMDHYEVCVVDQPKHQVPKIVSFHVVSCIAVSIITVFLAASQFPGVSSLVATRLPTTFAFSRILNLTVTKAVWLIFPATLFNAVNFFLVMNHSILAMCDSGLLPSVKAVVVLFGESLAPLVLNGLTVIGCCLLCTLMALRGSGSIYSMEVLVVYFSYFIGITILSVYIIFRNKFECLENTFRSPLLSYGAFYGIAVFLIATLFTIFRQIVANRVFLVVVFYVVACALYYFMFARRTQCFSEQEQKIMFVAYVVNGKIFATFQSCICC